MMLSVSGTTSRASFSANLSTNLMLYDAVALTPAIILASVQEQDLRCPMFGRCLQGRPASDRAANKWIASQKWPLLHDF
ncbi:hypothetical protein [Actimicrobium antarcticum]|uniref:hypothetical protein n=1 Tax=Actimicrobium antarcticum TaxID=1051899 RepID=UPI0031D8E983